MEKFIVQWSELGSTKWHSIGTFTRVEDAIKEASEFISKRVYLRIQSAVRVRVGVDGTYATVFRASSRLPLGYLEYIRKASLSGPKCRHIEEGDEVYCVECARRWGVTEKIECGEGQAKKVCYQCESKVHYLFDDGRCGKCTRLSPEEVKGEEENLS